MKEVRGMARPTKSVKTLSKNLTKEEVRFRLGVEEKLKGEADNISPPSYLNEKQVSIFNYIVEELAASEILGNLDIYVLATCVIAIERLQNIETMINEDFVNIFDKQLMAAKDKYTKDFFRCTNELSLSPQARAKLGTINLHKKEDEGDPLLKVLGGGKK